MINSMSNAIKMAVAIVDNHNVENPYGSNYCLFCNNREMHGKIEHSDDCPVLIAKTIIEKCQAKPNKRGILCQMNYSIAS